MSGRRWKSEAQSNAEALTRRERGYVDEHAASVRRAAIRTAPVGLPGMLRGFLAAWESEIKGRMHGQGVEWEPPSYMTVGTGHLQHEVMVEPGGGNALGAPRWDGETRAHLFGRQSRTDADGLYVEPMHWTVTYLSRRHPLKAMLLRALGMGGGQVTVVCPSCTSALPDEYAEAVMRDALGLAFRYYQDAPRGSTRVA